LSCHVVAKTHPTVSARPSGCGATPDYRPGDTKVEQLLDTVERNLLLSTEGTFRARIEFARARLARARKQPDLARGHYEKARLAASDQQAAAMVAKVVNALSRL